MEEIWKPIEGYSNYEVSSLGRIKNVTKSKLLNGSLDKNNYRVVSLFSENVQKTVKVHRVVALTFLPNILNKTQVNHINGIKDDNRLTNLEWATPLENTRHANRTGLTNIKGEKHGRSILKVADVIKIRTSLKSIAQLARNYKVSESAIRNIIKFRTWKHI